MCQPYHIFSSWCANLSTSTQAHVPTFPLLLELMCQSSHIFSRFYANLPTSSQADVPTFPHLLELMCQLSHFSSSWCANLPTSFHATSWLNANFSILFIPCSDYVWTLGVKNFISKTASAVIVQSGRRPTARSTNIVWFTVIRCSPFPSLYIKPIESWHHTPSQPKTSITPKPTSSYQKCKSHSLFVTR